MRQQRERIFRFLLRFFPAGFREDFGAEMQEAFEADHEDAGQRGLRGGRVRFWLRTLGGVFRIAPREHLDRLGGDTRYAVRMMKKRPLFTATATLSLAVGIGATTTVVAIFHAAFLRPVPGVTDDRPLVNVKAKSRFEETFDFVSYPNFADLRASSGVLADLAGFHSQSLSLAVRSDAEPEAATAMFMTASYFEVLGMKPRAGRFFDENEDAEDGAHPVVVVSSWLWKERLGSDPAVLGREIWLNGTRLTVVGVTPEGFRGHFIGFSSDLFLPASMRGIAALPAREDRSAGWLEVIGLLNEGVSLEQAAAVLEEDARRLEEAHPAVNRDLEIQVERTTGIDADLRGGFLSFLIVLLVVSGFVLGIACVNVANMLTTHVMARRGEMALRLALGAPRRRLIRQLLTESTLLAFLAGGLGILLAFWATRLTGAAFAAFDDRISLAVRLDPKTLAAALGVSLLTALVFGTLPAARACRGDLVSALKGSARQGGAGSRLWSGLVVTQVVLSLVVLVCAGLFLRVLQHVNTLDPGFDSERVYAAAINPALAGVEPGKAPELLRRILEETRSLRGTESAAFVNRVPLSLGARFFANSVALRIPGWDPPPGQENFLIEHAAVSDGYFETLRIPVLEGRGFGPTDRDGARRVAVVNQAFARRYFPSDDVLGATLRTGDDELTVVGVVRDSKYRRLDEASTPYVYLSFWQASRSRGGLLTRHGAAVGGYPGALRDAIRSAAPHLPIADFGALEDRLAVSYLPQRIAAGIAGVMGMIGLFLTAVGLHAVVAFAASRRSSEIGVRMSLGARPGDIVRMMLRQGLALTAIGIGIGIPLATGAAMLLSSFLVGMSPADPLTYLGIAAVLLAASLLACYLPARRAARTDPLAVLRLGT